MDKNTTANVIILSDSTLSKLLHFSNTFPCFKSYLDEHEVGPELASTLLK